MPGSTYNDSEYPLSAQSTAERLSPQDFYLRIDRLRADWTCGDEYKIAAQLLTLRRLIEKLPPRFYARAAIELVELERGRIVRNADWSGALSRLRRIASDWDTSRPSLVDCPECGIAVRGQFALKNHLLIVHDIEDVT